MDDRRTARRIAGSFLATLVIRWPAGRSIADGRSRCDACDAQLRVHELVPILSYLLLRRCRRCGVTIERRGVARDGARTAGMFGALFGWLLIALAALDAGHYWLPDALTLPLAGLGLAARAFGLPPPLADRLLAACLGYRLPLGVLLAAAAWPAWLLQQLGDRSLLGL